jgi:hypothetical protein
MVESLFKARPFKAVPWTPTRWFPVGIVVVFINQWWFPVA